MNQGFYGWPQGQAAGGPGVIQQIAVTGTAPNITFASIPPGFSALVLDFYVRSDAAATFSRLFAQFNGDTGANYDWKAWYGEAGSANTYADTVIRVGDTCAATSPASAFCAGRILIPRYGDTVGKKAMVAQGMSYRDLAGGIFVIQSLGVWRNTAAITSILLKPDSGNFVTGTVATLRGEP